MPCRIDLPAVRWFGAAVLTVFLVHQPMQAETTVGGSIGAKTTWSPAGSPYVAVQNIEVPAGGTLTIEPGTVVRFDKTLLIVRGTLVARGTKDQPIVFTSSHGESAAPADWGPVQFEPDSADAQFDTSGGYQSGSILQHVTVEYGQGLYFNGASPVADHCTLRFNRRKLGGAIYAANSRAVVRHSQISYNIAEDHGGGIRAAASELSILHCVLTHNSVEGSGGAISIDFSPARIEGNTIAHNRAGRAGGIATGEPQVGQSFTYGTAHSRPLITHNVISHNSAMYAAGGLSITGTPQIRNNTIAANRIALADTPDAKPSSSIATDRKGGSGAGMRIVGTYGGPAEIEQNVIVGNRGAFWGGGLFFDRASGRVRNNLIAHNQAVEFGGGASILVHKPTRGIAGANHGPHWQWIGNDFQHNTQGAIELAHAHFSGVQTVLIENCNLADNGELALINRTANPVTAKNVWWGTTEPAEINARIHDFFDQQQLGKVAQTPAAARLSISELPKIDEDYLQLLASPGPAARAGQGLNRLPDTPPSATVVWKPIENEKVAGYLVYFYRIEPGYNKQRIPARCHDGLSPVDVGNVTRTTIAGLQQGETYEFFVTAYDYDGRESGLSNACVLKIER